MHGEGISEPVRAHATGLAGVRIDQLPKAGLLRTLLDYLPSPVAVDSEEERLLASFHRPASLDVLCQQLQRFSINGERPLAAQLLLARHGPLDLDPAARAKGVGAAQLRLTARTQ